MPEILTYSKLRKRWLNWLREDDHSIWNQLYELIWNDCYFRILNEARKMREPNELNQDLIRLIDLGYLNLQLSGIRRLIDSRDDVISVPRVIDDMLKNVSALNRKDFILDLELPYDFVDAERKWRIDNPPVSGRVYCLPIRGELAFESSSLAHNAFDKLCGASSANRSANDIVSKSLLEGLASRLLTSQNLKDVKSYVNKYIAHAADPVSRANYQVSELSITLDKITSGIGELFRIAEEIGSIIYEGAHADVVPTPQYNVLKSLDRPFVKDVAELDLLHNKFDELRKSYGKDTSS